MESITVNNESYPVDAGGYLLDSMQWNEAVAGYMAAQDEVGLTEDHWEIIRFVQDYYAEFQVAPGMRLLVKAIRSRLGEEKANSRYLYRLFPQGPAKQVCRYAGLPKPVSCI